MGTEETQAITTNPTGNTTHSDPCRSLCGFGYLRCPRVRPESTCRSQLTAQWSAGPTDRMNAPPVEPLEQRLKLCRCQPHHPVLDRGPTELALLGPLGEEAQSRTAPPEPISSRAIAMHTMVVFLPLALKARHRAVSRTCAFQAISRTLGEVASNL